MAVPDYQQPGGLTRGPADVGKLSEMPHGMNGVAVVLLKERQR